jgi:hypothetical protein
MMDCLDGSYRGHFSFRGGSVHDTGGKQLRERGCGQRFGVERRLWLGRGGNHAEGLCDHKGQFNCRHGTFVFFLIVLHGFVCMQLRWIV